MKKPGLGRGINNFIKDANTVSKILREDEGDLRNINIDEISPNEMQARRIFDKDSLEELSESIKKFGIIQPLVVRKAEEGYVIIAGERRFRAAKLAGLKEVPAIVKDLNDENADKISLIENIQREDLNPIEEARGYKRVLDLYGITQEELALSLGKSRQYIGNTIRLLKLDPRVLTLMEKGLLTTSHGKLLLAIKDKDQQFKEAKRIVRLGNTVRETTDLLNRPKPEKKNDIFLEKAERNLSYALGTKVILRTKGKKKNIVIEYYNEEDLSRIYEKIVGRDKDEIL
ncbi:ParB/RepB/Spo0J family partition protein [Peptoniphilus catoniae]|uniref:ParB/RepB/Spo0J family partition protein n=1 Tax=Peptoniphilus catoniae TaxID=1660341 RepID=UPI0010FD9821|nr:ParB/RepB/Spo0J family partition protein [Peptoniphilus catoniae]